MMKRVLLYILMSIVSLGIQAQHVLVVEKTDGTKNEYSVETFQKASFISKDASQDYMIVRNINGDKSEYHVKDIKAITINVDKYNGHEYVDLGLSVKWATCNVGATTPEGYGDYFAWGETEPKNDYSWSTYKWCKGSSTSQTKYCTISSYGAVDNKTTLELADDAARANWGGTWRMPTKIEQDELRTKCTWTWTTKNDVYGYEVKSKTNGNSIFLPAAGRREGTSLDYAGSDGNYRSSSLYENGSYLAWSVCFYSYIVGRSHSYRYYGQSVRPVCP